MIQKYESILGAILVLWFFIAWGYFVAQEYWREYRQKKRER
jgi:hypothetical protein